MTKLAIPFSIALIVLGVGTYVEGRKSDRWGAARTQKLERFTKLVSQVPKQIDEWVGVDDDYTEEDRRQFEASHCTNFISRTYTNPEGQTINVYLVSGTGRHVTIHTPDWCYVGAGYEKVEDPRQYKIPMGSSPHPDDPELLTTIFRLERPDMKREIRIFWTFSDNGIWQGPIKPKNEFGGRPAMYKVYLITDVDEVGPTIEANPTLNFAKKFFPTINKILFQPGDEESNSESSE